MALTATNDPIQMGHLPLTLPSFQAFREHLAQVEEILQQEGLLPTQRENRSGLTQA